MATINSINSNIPIELAKGGTNATSLATTNGVIYYDGTRLVTTGAGTTGQFLTSNGAGVAPTYQSLSSTGDDLIFIQRQTASSSASLDFTSGINYSMYLLEFNGVTPAGTGIDIGLRITDVSSFKTTGYDSGCAGWAYNSATVANYNASTYFILIPALLNSDTYGSGYVWIFNIASSTNPVVRGQFSSPSNGVSASPAVGWSGGVYTSSITTTGFRVLAVGDTLATGVFTLYGVKES